MFLWLGIDKKKIKMRLTSKKKKSPESCVEKREDLSAASEVSTQSAASSLNSVELCELQELLKLKRSQLQMHNDVSAAVAVTDDLEARQTEGVLASMYYTEFY